jgi:hypothetical protein
MHPEHVYPAVYAFHCSVPVRARFTAGSSTRMFQFMFLCSSQQPHRRVSAFLCPYFLLVLLSTQHMRSIHPGNQPHTVLFTTFRHSVYNLPPPPPAPCNITFHLISPFISYFRTRDGHASRATRSQTQTRWYGNSTHHTRSRFDGCKFMVFP